MRINPFDPAAGPISSEPGSQTAGAQNVPAPPRDDDHATLVSDASSVGSLVNMAMSSPEIREDKVASLQQSISNGTYELDPEKIAASMIDEHA